MWVYVWSVNWHIDTPPPLALYTMDQAKADKGMDRVTDVVHEQELDKERVTRVRRQRGQCSVLH